MAIIAIIIIVGVVFGFIGYSTENTWMTGIGIVIAILFACCIEYCHRVNPKAKKYTLSEKRAIREELDRKEKK